jgi:cobalt/nickel transport system ATP-binding protein
MNAALEVQDLHYRYADGTVALRGVSLMVNEGQRVGLVGPNGAGKSTLLLHLNGLLPEKPGGDGAVKVFGKAITISNLLEVRRKVGLLFQDPNDQLFCPTLYEDVAFGPRQMGISEAEVSTRVAHALQLTDLVGKEGRLPHHLSGGEKRRACLAGLLATDAKILVLDEPTTNLDPRGRRELKQLLKDIGLTLLVATHDLELVAEICDTTIVLDAGKVVAAGDTIPTLSNTALMESHGLETPHILRHLHPHDAPVADRPAEQPEGTGEGI